MELSFLVYSILKQCWSVGYVSLLTLSFISSMSFFWVSLSLPVQKTVATLTVLEILCNCSPLESSMWSKDHMFFLQNIKPRCVLISIYQTNPGNTVLPVQWIHFLTVYFQDLVDILKWEHIKVWYHEIMLCSWRGAAKV